MKTFKHSNSYYDIIDVGDRVRLMFANAMGRDTPSDTIVQLVEYMPCGMIDTNQGKCQSCLTKGKSLLIRAPIGDKTPWESCSTNVYGRPRWRKQR